MQAMVLENYGQPLVLKDLPVPEIGSGEVLLRIRACGICGTDLKISTGRIATTRVPLVMGHEPMGEIVELAPDVREFNTGERVIVSIYQSCGDCKFCLTGRSTLCLNLKGRTGFELDGGFAEFLKVPATNLVKVPENISDKEAAILSCGVATPFHALRTRANVRPGDTVLVMGAGGLGIHAVQIARLSGASVIAVDVEEQRLNLAKEYGADAVIFFNEADFVDQVHRLAGPGVSVIFETVGQPPTIEAGLKVLEPGGKMVMAGYYPGKPFAAETPDIVLKELEILGTRAMTKQELLDLMPLVASGRIKPVVTNHFSLTEINMALNMLNQGQILGRAVVEP